MQPETTWSREAIGWKAYCTLDQQQYIFAMEMLNVQSIFGMLEVDGPCFRLIVLTGRVFPLVARLFAEGFSRRALTVSVKILLSIASRKDEPIKFQAPVLKCFHCFFSFCSDTVAGYTE